MGKSEIPCTATEAVDNPHETEETVEQFRREGEFASDSTTSYLADGTNSTTVERSTATAPIDYDLAVADVGDSPTADSQAFGAIPPDEDRRQSKHAETDYTVSGIEVTLAIGGLTVWFVLFAGGILISSEPYRNVLGTSSDVFEWMSAYVMTILFWTITNIGLLTCLAALLGAIGYRTRFANRISHDHLVHQDSRRMPLPFDGVHYISAVMRGFGIYALSFTGLLVLATDAFHNPDQGAYLRIASTMSIVGFYAGYDPATFAGLLERVKQFFETK